MAVGILALQGAFAEHGQMLDRLGVEHFEIRQLRDLEKKARQTYSARRRKHCNEQALT